jgi:hypothetical protein
MSPPSLRLTAARHALGLTTAEDLIETADALLTCGVYSYALGELGTARSAIMYEVEPLFFRALKEFHIPRPTPEEAAAIMVRHWIYRIAEEVTPALEELNRCFRETYGRIQFPSFVGLLESASGGGQLLGLAINYDDVEVGAHYGDLTPELREERLTALDRRACEFARDWVQSHLPRVIEPAWLSANGGLVASLARAIREGLRFAELPVLADALEEAGCADANLLAHLRDPGVHRERCCAVDLLLEGEEGGGEAAR